MSTPPSGVRLRTKVRKMLPVLVGAWLLLASAATLVTGILTLGTDLALAVLLLGLSAALAAGFLVDRRTRGTERRLTELRSAAQRTTSLRSEQVDALGAAVTARHEEVTAALAELGARAEAAEGRRRLDQGTHHRQLRERIEALSAEGAERGQDLVALLNLFQVLAPASILPLPTDFTASPRTILALVGEVIGSPSVSTIVECGSGSSTLWLAEACRRVDRGSVVALEHDPRYAAQTRQAIERGGLEGYAQVRTARLVPVEAEGEPLTFYDPEEYADLERIDLLFVDGPPGSTGRLARYPALPFLAPRLADGALVVMDDAARADEATALHRWLTETRPAGTAQVAYQAGRATVLRWSAALG